MPQLKPSLYKNIGACQELTASPAGLVVFGASGDLAHRKLFPSLFRLWQRNLLDESFYLLGCGRKELSDEKFRDGVKAGLKKFLSDVTDDQAESFLKRFYYIIGDYSDRRFYESIKERLDVLDKEYRMSGSRVFYLSVPPDIYDKIVQQLRDGGLSCPTANKNQPNPRLVIEKPFGHDLETARQLNRTISRCFDESNVYRIDHYLGKETVQNILMFRFANSIFEPVWNNNYVDHVQVTIAEKDGVGRRAGYYDNSGAIRDMIQNHTLQLISLAAMEPPVSFDADSVRDEKTKLLKAVRPFSESSFAENVVLGQYSSGTINGQSVAGYLEEESVAGDSLTETFIAARMFVDNWRWSGGPFYCRTGKCLASKKTEIVVTFKQMPHSMFASIGIEQLPPNILIMRIQPDEGISLRFQAKGPGGKMCLSTLEMTFNYKDIFGVEIPEAYQRLLLDCMAGDQTLFMRYDAVEISWKLLEPILQDRRGNKIKPVQYPAGAASFPQADELIEKDGRKWRPLKDN